MLDLIGRQTGTDKSSLHHNYLHYYEQHLTEYRHEEITFIEAGIGGYQYKDRGGQSLRMWREWFTKAKVVGFDLYDKSGLNIPGTAIYQGSQDDAPFLTRLIEKVGAPTIFIDDASHICDLTVKTFEIVFPLLQPGGWYDLEDVEGTYWDTWSKGTQDYNDFSFPHPVNLGRRLINDVNVKHIPGFQAAYPIESLHFYQNIIFIKKK
jgi:hypothetical protein